jgi:hypothetical protein
MHVLGFFYPVHQPPPPQPFEQTKEEYEKKMQKNIVVSRQRLNRRMTKKIIHRIYHSFEARCKTQLPPWPGGGGCAAPPAPCAPPIMKPGGNIGMPGKEKPKPGTAGGTPTLLALLGSPIGGPSRSRRGGRSFDTRVETGPRLPPVSVAMRLLIAIERQYPGRTSVVKTTYLLTKHRRQFRYRAPQ